MHKRPIIFLGNIRKLASKMKTGPVYHKVGTRQFIKKNPTRCNNISTFYYSILIWSSTCFGWHTAHHQEPKTALAASGFS